MTRQSSSLRLFIFIAAATIVLLAGVASQASALEVTMSGEAEGKAERARILLYLIVPRADDEGGAEAGVEVPFPEVEDAAVPDGGPEEGSEEGEREDDGEQDDSGADPDGADAAVNRPRDWEAVRRWLTAEQGVPADAIVGAEPQLVDGRHWVRRVAVTLTVDPAKPAVEEMRRLAAFIDAAAGQGLYPRSEIPNSDDDGTYSSPEEGLFVFFHAADPEKLERAAARDALERVRRFAAAYAKAAGAGTTRIEELDFDGESPERPTGLPHGMGLSIDGVGAGATVRAVVRFGESAPAGVQLLSAAGTAEVEMPVERAAVTVQYVSEGRSFVEQLADLERRLEPVRAYIKAHPELTLDLGGVRLYSGRGVRGLFDGFAGHDERVQSGAYRNGWVVLDRREGESLQDFRRRGERVAADLELSGGLTWGPRDGAPSNDRADQLAIERAKEKARLVAEQSEVKLGAVHDVSFAPFGGGGLFGGGNGDKGALPDPPPPMFPTWTDKTPVAQSGIKVTFRAEIP